MSDTGVFHCWICREQFPAFFRNIHHINPRGTGGKDTPDNLVDLCAGCHDALHAAAYKLLNPRHSEAQVVDHLLLLYKGKIDTQRRCLDLAIKVRTAMLKKKEEGMEKDSLISISTTLKKKHKDLFLFKAKDLGISQEAFLRRLVLLEISKFYPEAKAELANEKNYIKKK